MIDKPPHRKKVKLFHEPGDFHEFTFSCYRRRNLLTNDAWRSYLAESINEAAVVLEADLVAFVFMPNHVHLLVYPRKLETFREELSRFLAAVKRPVSSKVKADLKRRNSRLLEQLTIQTRPGKKSFRFWQEGPGYDRNLRSEKAVAAAIEYIHLNPTRKNLVQRTIDWKWSSARWYASDQPSQDSSLPTIHGPPLDFFTTTNVPW